MKAPRDKKTVDGFADLVAQVESTPPGYYKHLRAHET